MDGRDAHASVLNSGRSFPAIFLALDLCVGAFYVFKRILFCRGWLRSTILNDRHAHSSVQLLCVCVISHIGHMSHVAYVVLVWLMWLLCGGGGR